MQWQYQMRYYLGSALGRVLPALRMRTRYGFSISGNPRDMVARRIFTFGFWEPDLSAMICDSVGEGTHFYDLGTNMGYFSLLAASRGARVTGFEASPEMARLAQANYAAQGVTGKVHNVALAAQEGELVLYDRSGPTNTGSRTIFADMGEGVSGKSIHAKVRAARLLSMVEIDPAAANFFKIDIEGAEGPVLEELLGWLKANPHSAITIVAEIAQTDDGLLESFKQAGCKIAFLRNDYALLAYANAAHTYHLVDDTSPRPPKPFETVITRSARSTKG